MDENTPPSPDRFPVFPRLGLILILLVSLSGVYSAVAWIFGQVHHALGMEIAAVVAAFLAIIVMGLILVGVRVGFSTKHALCENRANAERIYRLFKRSRTFQEFWLYLGLEAELKNPVFTSDEPTISVAQPSAVELTFPLATVTPIQATASVDNELAWVIELEEEVTRRGRTPEHPIHRWARVVYAWEHRDRWNEPLTLDEFLCKEFGENKDGSPKVSRKSFYDWRKKVHQAAREYQAVRMHAQSQGKTIGECKQISD